MRQCTKIDKYEVWPLATIYVDTGWLHVEDGGICGPDLRMCQLWQPLLGDQRARASQKTGHKGQNLVNFCFLRMGDQYRFQGPGLWTTQGWRVSGYVARERLWWWICGEGASSVTDGLLVIGLSHWLSHQCQPLAAHDDKLLLQT